jgi:hypothetical protein
MKSLRTEGEGFCVDVWSSGQKVKMSNLENKEAWIWEWKGNKEATGEHRREGE